MTKDLTGLKFNEWTVIGYSHTAASHRRYWSCECSCGAKKAVDGFNLTSGRSRSCRVCSLGKLNRRGNLKHGMTGTKEYLAWHSIKVTSSKFGVGIKPEWVNSFQAFYDYIGPSPSGNYRICRYDREGDYVPGNIYWKLNEQPEKKPMTEKPEKSRRPKTHGLSNTREYRIWQSIKTRCFSKNSKEVYKNYGGRGIAMTPEWVHDFKAFYDYIGPAPSPRHIIWRKDTDGNYEPGNIYWKLRRTLSNVPRKTDNTISQPEEPEV